MTWRVRFTLVLAVLFVSTAGMLWAHARLVRSDPASGERLAAPPRVIRLEFSETVSPATSRVELVAPDSQHFALVLRVESENGKTLLATVPELGVAGDYRVDWRLIGPDGHAVTGTYGFHVDTIPRLAATPPAPAPTAAEPADAFAAEGSLQVGLRFVSSLSLTLLIGSVVFSLFVLPRVSLPTAESSSGIGRRLRTWALLGAVLFLATLGVRLTIQGAMLAGDEALRASDLIAIVMRSSWGRAWLIAALFALVVIVVLQVGPRIRSVWPVLAVACLGLAFASPGLGHPSSTGARAIAHGLDFVHVLAAGGWVGSLLVMAIVAMPQAFALDGEQRTSAIQSMLRAFTPVALTCAAVLAASGAGEAWLQLGSLAALWSTAYGLALVRKLVLVMLVAAVGAWHWRVAQPTLGNDRSLARLRGSLALDVALVLGLLLFTAILTGTPTPVDMP